MSEITPFRKDVQTIREAMHYLAALLEANLDNRKCRPSNSEYEDFQEEKELMAQKLRGLVQKLDETLLELNR